MTEILESERRSSSTRSWGRSCTRSRSTAGVSLDGPDRGPPRSKRRSAAGCSRPARQPSGGRYLNAHAPTLRAGALHALGRLHDLVWKPVEPLLDAATAVVVIPSGPLFYLPFHALWDGERHVIEGREMSTAPSARAWIALARRRREPGVRTRSLVLGYEVEGLPGIAREVEAVEAALPGATVLFGREATREALRRRGAEASIVHLAAHAEFRGDNPLLSSIHLADGRLTFYDLFDLRLQAEVVVLSGARPARIAWWKETS